MTDSSRNVQCDQSSGAQAGQPCYREYEGRGQCVGAALLQCTHGVWVQVACPTGLSCHAGDNGLGCQ